MEGSPGMPPEAPPAAAVAVMEGSGAGVPRRAGAVGTAPGVAPGRAACTGAAGGTPGTEGRAVGGAAPEVPTVGTPVTVARREAAGAPPEVGACTVGMPVAVVRD